MAVRLRLAPEVTQDLAQGYDWYEQRRPGLGEEFLESVETAFDAIRRDPKSCPEVFQSYRRALVRRFPYCVFYEVLHDTVTVYCIVHAARDPEKWRRRMP